MIDPWTGQPTPYGLAQLMQQPPPQDSIAAMVFGPMMYQTPGSNWNVALQTLGDSSDPANEALRQYRQSLIGRAASPTPQQPQQPQETPPGWPEGWYTAPQMPPSGLPGAGPY